MSRWRSLRRLLSIVAVVSHGAFAGPVRAQSPENVRKLSAEALFGQGLRLTKSGDYESACPKFAESQRLDPGIGTLLYLADCFRAVGKTASAWVTFREAAFQARQLGQTDREATATSHADSLRATLTLLSIEFERVPDGVTLELELDGNPISRELIELPFPVDPGRHALDVKASGHAPWSTAVSIEPRPGAHVVRVPTLAPRGAPPKVRRNAASAPPHDGWKGVGWIALGAGLGALGGASALYYADGDSSLGPIVIGSFGALSAGTGVVLVLRSNHPSSQSSEASASIHAPLLAVRGAF